MTDPQKPTSNEILAAVAVIAITAALVVLVFVGFIEAAL